MMLRVGISCDLERANLSNGSLQGADLTGAHCLKMAACGSNFTGARLGRAKIINADLTNTNLTDVNLESADLSGTDISKSNLFQADLRSATLTNAKLSWSNLSRVDLSSANLNSCNLTGASFIEANLIAADLTSANLRFARFVDSQLDNANLTDCRVYGTSVWNVTLQDAIQRDLAITRPDEVTITVDNLAIAQFIYLLLDSNDIRKTIETISSKVVLILGRFTPDRFSVLQALREALRDRDYLPVLFDFAGPSNRDITETISTLAHLARFVLADITDARSVPQELMAIVPHLPSVPVQPLLLATEKQYEMFEHFKRYPWVLATYEYKDVDGLLSRLDEEVIEPAEMMVRSHASSAAQSRLER
jgi:uncharacterized protein YjbI with pentapeptide repeats